MENLYRFRRSFDLLLTSYDHLNNCFNCDLYHTINCLLFIHHNNAFIYKHLHLKFKLTSVFINKGQDATDAIGGVTFEILIIHDNKNNLNVSVYMTIVSKYWR